MRIVIAAVQVPFIKGGATLMTQGLAEALRRRGLDVEIVTLPFKFFPERYLARLIEYCAEQDFNSFSGYGVDKVIALQFPMYYVTQSNMTVWLMHQHRAVYDLYDEKNASSELTLLREAIMAYDTRKLSAVGTVYSMSQNVSRRLEKFNHIDSVPLYHPPFGEDNFYCEEPYGYVFYPSRLETLKRQDLLIQAMGQTKTPMKAIIAGVGGQRRRYERLVEELQVGDKVKLIGQITEEEKYTLYARSLAIFFGPYDEDYGYVTLEAMLSSKPVITCADSGGPLEFIVDGVNGCVSPPSPEALAERIDFLYDNRRQSQDMGKSGFAMYREKCITWERVVGTLLA